MPISIDLSGKTAVVTGGGRGIGRAAAEAIHAAGANVAVLDRDGPAARSAAVPFGDRGLGLEADVSRSGDVEAAVAEAKARYGGIDILINNAGVDAAISILDMDEDEWDRVLSINLKSVFLVTKAVLPSMIERGGGSVVSLASIVARQGAMNGGIHYAASKGGIIAFTKTLARQMATYNVRANAVAPGVVDTDLIAANMAPEVRTRIEAAIPTGRLGSPQEIGTAIAFLASPASSYITGATLDANGGFWMG